MPLEKCFCTKILTLAKLWPRNVDISLNELKPATVNEVSAIIKKSSAKQCSLDPVPTWLLKECYGANYHSHVHGVDGQLLLLRLLLHHGHVQCVYDTKQISSCS